MHACIIRPLATFCALACVSLCVLFRMLCRGRRKTKGGEVRGCALCLFLLLYLSFARGQNRCGWKEFTKEEMDAIPVLLSSLCLLSCLLVVTVRLPYLLCVDG